MNPVMLRKLVESIGVREAGLRIVNLIKEKKIPLDGFSLKGLWEATIGPVSETLPLARRGPGGIIGNPLLEEVRSNAFTMITQQVLISQMLKGYAQQPSKLDSLVSPFNSNSRYELITGLTAMDGPEDVEEGSEYPDSQMTDRGTMGPEPKKRGRQVNITMETILYDKTASVMTQAQQIGVKTAYDREYRGMQAIQDVSGYSAFYPMVSGLPTQTALYRTTAAGTAWYNKTVNQSANTLTDWTDIEAALKLFVDMTDEKGHKILVQPTAILVPFALLATASHIVNATETQIRTNTQGTVQTGANILANLGVSGMPVIWSPHMADATTWYIGDFKSAFYEQVIIAPTLEQLPGDPRRDIIGGFVSRYKARVYAVDDKFVVKQT